MASTSVSTKTVVVADDTAFVRDRFATALLGAGHSALTVKSAAELLVRVRADLARIDLIVLDVVFLVVVRREIELERSHSHDFEIRATLRATELIALVDIELVDFDFGITFRTGGHTCSWRRSLPPRGWRSQGTHGAPMTNRDNLRIIART